MLKTKKQRIIICSSIDKPKYYYVVKITNLSDLLLFNKETKNWDMVLIMGEENYFNSIRNAIRVIKLSGFDGSKEEIM